MVDVAAHIPLRSSPWSADHALEEIASIVADALTHFDDKKFWPVHPVDEEFSDGETSLYAGAAGVIWGLSYLHRAGATTVAVDFRQNLDYLLEVSREQFKNHDDYSAHGSLLIGDLGTALAVMVLAPNPEIAGYIYERAAANRHLPVRELMWGMAGSMLACIEMSKTTNEDRWRELFRLQSLRLFEELTETDKGPLWAPDLYGKRLRYLGPVHGFAGNMIPLMRGWDWLTTDQRARVRESTIRTLSANAWKSEYGLSWQAVAGREEPPRLCQHCHGAPGIVTAFSDAPFTSPEFEEMLRDGGSFVWSAGPLAKGSNLCHGTGGNGYAFLKLYHRTQDALWLERARAFAMTAIAQCREAREELGRGRYSLWTGDIGLAIYLWHCVKTDWRFPTIDFI